METPHGLRTHEVEQRRQTGHVNVIDTQSSRSLAHIFRSNVFTRFNALLGALFLIILVTGSPADGLFEVVLVANTLLGTG